LLRVSVGQQLAGVPGKRSQDRDGGAKIIAAREVEKPNDRSTDQDVAKGIKG